MKMLLYSTVVLLQLICLHVSGEEEYIVAHGVHHPIDEHHYQDDVHNTEFDHEAILGSEKAKKVFGELPPHEAKKRLASLVDQMDENKDHYISRTELADWIMKSFLELNKEEANDKMHTQDMNNDTEVTWSEYLTTVYGYRPHEMSEMELDKNPQVQLFVRMVHDDRDRFQRADMNKDGALDPEEYAAFLHPLDYPHMQDYELDRLVASYDKNEDGYVDFKEYIGESPGSKEAQIVDKENFDDYDKDQDGRLSRQEVRVWMLPDLTQTVTHEVDHLYDATDLDHNDKLSKQEILDQHLLWVGSSATDYGNELHKHDPQEL